MSSLDSGTVCAGVTDCFHTLANEPSLGLYYVVEHIQRSVPALVADKAALNKATEAMRGIDLDAGFDLSDLTAATAGGTQRSLANTALLARDIAAKARWSVSDFSSRGTLQQQKSSGGGAAAASSGSTDRAAIL